MPRRIYQISLPPDAPSSLRRVIADLNEQLAEISEELGRAQGTEDAPSFKSDLSLSGKMLKNVRGIEFSPGRDPFARVDAGLVSVERRLRVLERGLRPGGGTIKSSPEPGPGPGPSPGPGPGPAPGGQLTSVHFITQTGDITNPLDMWGGFDGEGFDNRLFMATGARLADKAGAALFSHQDGALDDNWAREFLDSGFETAGKIRDWTNAGGERALYVWMEGPDDAAPTESVLLKRKLGGAFSFENIPHSGNTVGGRALAVNHWAAADLFAGQAKNWTAGDSEIWQKNRSSGAWTRILERGNSLLWDMEFEDGGERWDFFTVFGDKSAFTRRNGVTVANPGNGARAAAYFPAAGAMFVTEELQEASRRVRKFNGTSWDTVLDTSPGKVDNIQFVNRGPGELWVTSFDPFQVFKSFNGTSWEKVLAETFDTDTDTNLLTAVTFFKGRVWAATSDATAGGIRIYKEV